jgi:Fe/S biogenesis protein NfuA
VTEPASRPLAITASARQRIEDFRAAEPDPTERVLSVRITGEADGEYVHALSLEPVSKVRDDDSVQHEGDLAIVVAGSSVAKLRGATIDWSEDPLHTGFVVLTPNKPPPPPVFLPTLPMSPGAGQAVPGPPLTPGIDSNLDTDVARHVVAVLDEEVNPSIASHGGHAELAGVEGSTAYLRLGGGCVGCGMATVTLSQGIEVAITQAVPEIDRVVDVTDHASGTNPYFEQAKK